MKIQPFIFPDTHANGQPHFHQKKATATNTYRVVAAAFLKTNFTAIEKPR
jgi:hypothetical protein